VFCSGTVALKITGFLKTTVHIKTKASIFKTKTEQNQNKNATKSQQNNNKITTKSKQKHR